MPNNNPITIKSIIPTSLNTPLSLSDNGNSTVSQGDTVTWMISNLSGVAAITGIVDNSTNQLFSTPPAKMPGNSGNWQGTISNTASGSETYTIQYQIVGSTTIYSFDPTIQINP